MPKLFVDKRLQAVVLTPALLASDLPTAERLAVAVLAAHGDQIYPAIPTVAAMMGCSPATARRAIHALKERGWLTITPRTTTGGAPTSNLYRLTPPGTPESAVPPCSRNGSTVLPNRHPKREESEIPNSEAEGTYVPSAAVEPPAPPPDKQMKGRKYPPEVHKAAVAFTNEFRKDCTAAGSPPAPDTFARDLALACKVVQHYGVDSARDMGARFFKFREVRNMMLTMAEFYRVREYVFHEMMKGAIRRPYPTFSQGHDRA